MPSQKWAIIGSGQISRSVASDLQNFTEVEIVAVYSRTLEHARSFASDFSIATWSDDVTDIYARPDIDVVYIATPFATHYELARQALDARKHVLVEKPMTLNAKDSSALFDHAQSLGLFIMEAMWFKFSPVLHVLHEQIMDGVIGEVTNLRASFGIPLALLGSGSRLDTSRSGGTLLDQGIYPITLAQQIFGEPAQIRTGGNLREDGLDFSEHFTFEYAGGEFAQCSSSMTSFSELTASVGGTKGWITMTAPFWASDGLTIHAGSSEQIFRNPLRIVIPREGNGYAPMLRSVISSIAQQELENAIHGRGDTLSVAKTMDHLLSTLRANSPIIG